MKATARHVVVVVYDGIENSVFDSQVLEPLLKELELDYAIEITLISFEKKLLSGELLCKKVPAHDRLHLVLARKIPFMGKLSLYPALWQLINLLKFFNFYCSELRARGPLAGWIVLHATNKLFSLEKIQRGLVPLVLIQARGLAAEEYRYTAVHKKRSFIGVAKDAVMQSLLYRVELEVYGYSGPLSVAGKYCIQAVSNALKDYLAQTFLVASKNITIAVKDIIPKSDPEFVATCRVKKRNELGISHDAYVYVYSGSFKPWQCVQETVTQAAEILKKDARAFFLVLSADVENFRELIKKVGIDASRYLVICASHTKLKEYLAAADVGFLLREDDVINWVSRPTKMLEYQSVGLEILHNGTIACLADQ